jgi:hypothetical protein
MHKMNFLTMYFDMQILRDSKYFTLNYSDLTEILFIQDLLCLK